MQSNYKILVSAYACNPLKGSEPGVGWNWIIELQKIGYNLTVLTRKKNKKDIDNSISSCPELKKINFIYHDLPPLILKLKKIIGIYAYYELWQLTALKKVKEVHSESQFDLVHHLTFGSFRQPSYLYKLGIPFYFGPVGGGEYAPPNLLNELPLKYKLKEEVRKISNHISLYRRSLRSCFAASELIFCKTNETRNLIPLKYRHKAVVQHEIGQNFDLRNCIKKKAPEQKGVIKILFAGRLLYWKGAHIALLSFYEYSRKYPNASLTFIGEGEFFPYLKKLCKKIGLENKVTFRGNVAHSEMSGYYQEADIFLFPSFHDSSGNVILEALKFGLPVVALKTGGPLHLLSENCPSIVECKTLKQSEVINNISEMLLKLSIDHNFYVNCSDWCSRRIKQFSWSESVNVTYQKILHI